MPVPGWHPDIALADLRVRQGRFAEAEELLLGKDQSMQALLPAARLHLARGDHELARAVHGGDCASWATTGCGRWSCWPCSSTPRWLVATSTRRRGSPTDRARCSGLDISPLAGSGRGAQRSRARRGRRRRQAVALVERPSTTSTRDRCPGCTPRCWSSSRDCGRRPATAQAPLDARRPARPSPASTSWCPRGRRRPPRSARRSRRRATPRRRPARSAGKWWVAAHAGTTSAPRQQGLRYLAELVASRREHHALDLVDRVEGVDPTVASTGGRLATPAICSTAQARAAYRRRIECLRADIDDALAEGRLDAAEAMQVELDQLVGQLARAFGLGGRDRQAASAAERARLNVTRALRTRSPGSPTSSRPAAVLDRRVRTGLVLRLRAVDDDDVSLDRSVLTERNRAELNAQGHGTIHPYSRRDRRRDLPDLDLDPRGEPRRVHVQPVPGHRRRAAAVPHRIRGPVPARRRGGRHGDPGRVVALDHVRPRRGRRVRVDEHVAHRRAGQPGRPRRARLRRVAQRPV